MVYFHWPSQNFLWWLHQERHQWAALQLFFLLSPWLDNVPQLQKSKNLLFVKYQQLDLNKTTEHRSEMFLENDGFSVKAKITKSFFPSQTWFRTALANFALSFNHEIFLHCGSFANRSCNIFWYTYQWERKTKMKTKKKFKS